MTKITNNTLPKFRTTRGELTVYAFACGYIEEYNDSTNRVMLYLDGTWHIKWYHNGDIRVWNVFDRADYKKARKYFNSLKRNLRKAK